MKTYADGRELFTALHWTGDASDNYAKLRACFPMSVNIYLTLSGSVRLCVDNGFAVVLNVGDYIVRSEWSGTCTIFTAGMFERKFEECEGGFYVATQGDSEWQGEAQGF